MEREPEERTGQAKDDDQDEAPVDGPGGGATGDDLGDTSQDSPGR